MAEGQLPAGAQQWPNDFGDTGWDGPQPPKGDNPHRYFFRLYAVRQPLDLPEVPHVPEVHQALENRDLASGVVVGTFGR